MTTQTPSNPCDNCGDPVQVRRPSDSGKHWCQKPSCRAARQRFYYRQRAIIEARRAEGQTLQAMVLALLTAIIKEQWPTDGCPKCGRSDALMDWVHPTPGWTGVCNGTGSAGNVAELQPYFQVVWAEDCPF